MSTPCIIALESKVGGFKYIVCQHDGYIDDVGKKLFEHYKDYETVEKLVNLGDISALGKTPVENPNGWNYKIPNDYSMCTTYKSRRGDEYRMGICKSKQALARAGKYTHAIYLFENNTWYVKQGRYRLLENELKRLAKNNESDSQDLLF